MNSRGDLRLLDGSRCPKGTRLVILGRRGPKGAPGRAAKPEHDFVGETTKQTELSRTKNAVATVITLRSLPAGSWEFSAETTLVNFGRSDYVRCKVVAAGKQVASGAATVGTPPTSASTGVPPAAATVANLGLIGTTVQHQKFTASLACWHDLKSKGAEPPYLDPGAVLLARPVGAITRH